MMRGIGEQEKLKKPYQNGKAVNDQQDAQHSGKEARLVHQIAKRKEPDTKKYLGDHKPMLVGIEEYYCQS
jgi:hypothetical protein